MTSNTMRKTKLLMVRHGPVKWPFVASFPGMSGVRNNKFLASIVTNKAGLLSLPANVHVQASSTSKHDVVY